jgi:hypothetical protein
MHLIGQDLARPGRGNACACLPQTALNVGGCACLIPRMFLGLPVFSVLGAMLGWP